MAEMLPLDVMLAVMREKFSQSDLDGAVRAARDAAPYVHGRVAPVRAAGDLAGVPDDELDSWTGGCG